MEIAWPLVLFSLLAGAGGCTFAYVGLSELLKVGEGARFQTSVLALAITIVGGCCSVAHLASPQNVMAAVWNLGSFSGISLELIMIGITAIIMIVYLIVLKRSAEAAGARKALAVLGIIAGLLLAFITGHGYVIEAQAAWNTELLPLAYLGTALALGAFIYQSCAISAKVDAEDLAKTARPVGAGALIGAVTALAYAAYAGIAASPAVAGFGVVVCGVVVTAVCGILVIAKKQFATTIAVPVIGAIAAFVGALSLRCFMWIVGGGFLTLFQIASTTRIFS